MANESPFEYLKLGADLSNQQFANIQNAILKTRAMQLQQEAQIFGQGIALKELDIKEKQLAFDNQISLKKLEMAGRAQGWDDLLNASRLKSQDALTRYREAQAAKLEARDTASGYIDTPIGGSAQDWLNYDDSVNTGAAAISESWGIPEVDPLDGALNEAMSEQGPPNTGNRILTENDALPIDEGSEASASLFGGTPFSPLQIPPQQRAAAVVATESVQSQQPTSSFDRVQKIINQEKGRVANSDLTQGIKLQRIQELNGNLLRIASTEYKADRRAQDFLNNMAPERESVEAAAAAGDWSTARSLINENAQQLGAVNPVLNDAYNRGAEQYKQTKIMEAKQKQLDSILKQLESTSLPTGMEATLQARAQQLSSEIYGTGNPEIARSTLLDLRPVTP